MILYVPSSAAQRLSAALWQLARPAHVAVTGDTANLFPWVTDARGDVWLQVKTGYEIAVHPEAELGGIAEILQPWVDSGDLPPDTLAELSALVVARRGQAMTPWEFLPQFFKDQALSLEQMIGAGRLASPA